MHFFQNIFQLGHTTNRMGIFYNRHNYWKQNKQPTLFRSEHYTFGHVILGQRIVVVVFIV